MEQGPRVRFYTLDLDGDEYLNVDPQYPGIQTLLSIWRRQELAYRPDLTREDPLGELRYVSQVGRGKVRCIIDVPFLQGTLALNSVRPEAYSAADIDILQDMARVLSAAFHRSEDFRVLEERNAELEVEIAERKRIERQLVHLERLRAVAELSAGFCHNFNNILTGVLGPAQLLARKTTDPDQLQMVEAIIAAGERATDLVGRLHWAVRGEPEHALGPVSVDDEIRRAVGTDRAEWQGREAASGPPVDVRLDLGGVPPIRGNDLRLQDILHNLLRNAVQAMPAGGVITLSTRRDGDDVVLTVSDTGVGMDESTRWRVFEPFFTTRQTVGPGLGLSTVHATVGRWGGDVQVDSQPDQGSTFTLRLPVWRGPGPRGA